MSRKNVVAYVTAVSGVAVVLLGVALLVAGIEYEQGTVYSWIGFVAAVSGFIAVVVAALVSDAPPPPNKSAYPSEQLPTYDYDYK